MRLLLVRHAQSVSNAHREAVALPEAEGDRLTERGQEQAQAAARSLRGTPATRLIVSPMRRARETAAPIAEALGLEVEINDGIHELRESAEYLELPPEEQRLRRWSNWMTEHGDDPDWAPPGGESFNTVLGRVRTFKEDLERLGPGERPIVVSHGIFKRFFLLDSVLEDGFEAWMAKRLWHLRSVNCGLSVFETAERHHPADPVTGGWTCLSWMLPLADEA